MKRILSLLIVACISFSTYPQRRDLTPRIDIEGVLKTSYESYPAGTPVMVMNIIHLETRKENGIYLSTVINNVQVPIPSDRARKILELHPKNMEQFWMWEYIKADMLGYYYEKGYSKSLRNELISESDEYMDGISDLYYDDTLIEMYVRNIFVKVTPRQFNSRRTEQANVKIVQSPTPYANMLANGTLLISTGLLSTLDSEEELTAIIASNIAHHVLDHPVINVKKQISRARRAEFWGGFMVVVAGGLEIALTENNDNYIPGGILLTAAVADEALNYSAAQRLGMGFTKKQIKEADRVAKEYLKFSGTETAALSSALYKIADYHVGNPRTISNENFTNLRQRIKDLGDARKSLESRLYQRRMSGVNTLNAIIQLNSNNYEAAAKLAEKNILNKLATDEDYVVLVKANMHFAATREENEKCLELIQQGKKLSEIPNLELYKQEILVMMRLDKQAKANELLGNYITMLSDFKESTSNFDDSQWADKEINWANKLHDQIIKF